MMASHHDGVNPLRPYYIPATIGEPPEPVPAPPGPRALAQPNSTGRYASKARDIFSDIDYKTYEPSPSVVQTVKELLDELLWKYTSVLMAQPFEVAKTIMQVRAQDDLGGLVAAAEAAEEARQRQVHQRMDSFDQVGGPFPRHSRAGLGRSSPSIRRDHPANPSPGHAPRLRLGPRRVGLLHLAPPAVPLLHPLPLLAEPPTPLTPAAAPPGRRQARARPPAHDKDPRLGIRGHRPAVAEGGRLGRVEGLQCDVCLLGAAVAARELVAQPAECPVQCA